LELPDTGFDASVLSEFRARLAVDDQAERLLGQMLARLRERGCWPVVAGSALTPPTCWPRYGSSDRLGLVTETLRPRAGSAGRRGAELADHAGA
jgi:hypothetical protein